MPEIDYEKPVAYTPDGQPLYAHPSAGSAPAEAETTIVHMTRSMEPAKQEIPQAMKDKHDESVRKYPQLDLSEHEYVILSVRRHMIGMLAAVLIVIILIGLVCVAMVYYPSISNSFGLSVMPSQGTVILFGTLTCAMLVGILYILRWVYTNNLFFLTNENIIEKTQLTPFSSNVKSSGLGGVIDVSYRQAGIIQQMLDFGTVQIGTQDDEVPYIFNYVARPKRQASILKDAVEAFKNGRAINEDSIGEN